MIFCDLRRMKYLLNIYWRTQTFVQLSNVPKFCFLATLNVSWTLTQKVILPFNSKQMAFNSLFYTNLSICHLTVWISHIIIHVSFFCNHSRWLSHYLFQHSFVMICFKPFEFVTLVDWMTTFLHFVASWSIGLLCIRRLICKTITYSKCHCYRLLLRGFTSPRRAVHSETKLYSRCHQMLSGY